MVGGYRGSYSPASSDTAELARDQSDEDSTEEEETTSSSCSAGKEYRPMEWTDEKHSLYLKSMEASFVDQLYNSLGFLGSRLKTENVPDVGSSRRRADRKPSEQQFKVLRAGLWQQMNVKQPEYCFNRRDESREFLTSPWIKHFRPTSKTQCLESSRPEAGSKPESQLVSSNGKKGIVICSSSSATSLKQNRVGRSHFREQEEINVGEEASDQNFIDEETKGEKASSSSSSKKMKIVMNESSRNDQVVPHGKTPAT